MLSQQKIIQNEESCIAIAKQDEYIFNEVGGKPEVYCHDTVNADNTLSFMFGATAAILISSNHGWLFSLAAWACVTGCLITANYLSDRETAINSIPKMNTSHTRHLEITIPISEKHMSDANVYHLADDKSYYLGFCIKRAFAEWMEWSTFKSPLQHSSIIIIPDTIMNELEKLSANKQDEYLSSTKEIIIFGRQSVAFRESAENKTTQESVPIRFYKAKGKTQLDNEKYYGQLGRAPFKSTMTQVSFSGKEIKDIINRVNQSICNKDEQFFDLIQSNCYSGSVCVLAMAIEVFNERYVSFTGQLNDGRNTDHAILIQSIHAQLKSLCTLMVDTLHHNYGQGVLNNKAVVDQVNIALKIAGEFEERWSIRLRN